ncbi:DEAD/DEAH box helicase, putative [Plasmodium malariae]|uniref:DEAD/DEAH box helicase, putative n=1 Tax=Plasmodium malariae TaxID=5858 RepID=A0A1C3KAH0_PLAMA|nr:DEAD/DEAH box helicase, putative [Plasmodium malariae]
MLLFFCYRFRFLLSCSFLVFFFFFFFFLLFLFLFLFLFYFIFYFFFFFFFFVISAPPVVLVNRKNIPLFIMNNTLTRNKHDNTNINLCSEKSVEYLSRPVVKEAKKDKELIHNRSNGTMHNKLEVEKIECKGGKVKVKEDEHNDYLSHGGNEGEQVDINQNDEFNLSDIVVSTCKEEKSDMKEVCKGSSKKCEYLYMSEHLRIRNDKQIFVSKSLNEYINDHINIICSCDDTLFQNRNGMENTLMDLGLKLKFLRHRERIKRKRKKARKNKRSSPCSKSNDLLRNGTITNGELQINGSLLWKRGDITEFPLEDIEPLSSSLEGEFVPEYKSIHASNTELPEKAAEMGERYRSWCNLVKSGDDSDSSFLFSDSSDSEENSTDSSNTSDEEIIERLEFDEEELSNLKKLERAKNVYFRHINEICIKYNMMSHFNLKFFEKVKSITDKNIKMKHKNHNDMKDLMDVMRNIFSNEDMVKKIELKQKKLRADVINSLFGFHIISDNQPMKIPIKCMNRLRCENQPAANIFAYRSLQNRRRAETALDELWNASGMGSGKGSGMGSGKGSGMGSGKGSGMGSGKGSGMGSGKGSGVSSGTVSGKGEQSLKLSGDKNKCSVSFNEDINKIESVTKNSLEKYINNIKKSSKIQNKINNLKQYILVTNWNSLRKHSNYINMVYEERIEHKKVLANLCYNQMKAIEQKRKIIVEREEKERMRLLKENNMDEYIKLIKKTKNKRLQELVAVTEKFLSNMTSSMLLQKGGGTIEKKINGSINGEIIISGRCSSNLNDSSNSNSSGGSNHNGSGSSDGMGKSAGITKQDENANESHMTNYKNTREEYYRLSHSVKEKVVQPSILVGGKLMQYQLEGLEWLVSLYNNNLHGILADEMGLGKTVQTISLFAYLKEFKYGTNKGSAIRGSEGNGTGSATANTNLKSIVIVPLSTLPNWINEFRIWCPTLNVITYIGNKIHRRNMGKHLLECEFDICLTTFDFVIKEKTVLMKIAWNYIVVDEGHRMKNNKSRFHKILSEFKSKHRVLLTGTPLQNNLSELWSLLNFLLPRIFCSCVDFEKWFIEPLHNEKGVYESITEEEQLLIINRLHSVLLPFMLRRVKKDVLKSLPKKYEYNVHIELSLYQKILYKQIETKGFKQVNQNGSVTTKTFQNIVMQLRKIVNHPYLFLDDYNIDEMLIKCSGKFEVLDRMLPKLVKFKHKILIFSQMTKLMDILCDYLDLRQYKYHRLDGNIALNERKKIIEAFNRGNDQSGQDGKREGIDNNGGSQGDGESGVSADNGGRCQRDSTLGEKPRDELANGGNEDTMIFILSTRSGSLGLNLQAADTVIIFDSDFNPHQDIQAMCRCHRIGQKNVVKVFRFITLSEVEELVLKKAQNKLKMNDKVIQAGLYNNIYNDEDRQNKLKDIFKRYEQNDATTQPTNPILLNYYMGRNEEEIDYFLHFDKNYFGEHYFSVLNSLSRENLGKGQFTYMSEDEEGKGREVSDEGDVEIEVNVGDETDVEIGVDVSVETSEHMMCGQRGKEQRNSVKDAEHSENLAKGCLNKKQDDSFSSNLEHEKNDVKNIKTESEQHNVIMSNHSSNKLKRGQPGERDEVSDKNSINSTGICADNCNNKSTLSFGDVNGTSLQEGEEMDHTILYNTAHNAAHSASHEVQDDFYSFILREENQNEVERVLIKTNKLINKEELPSYLFYDDTDECTEINFKRRRKVINANLMEEEKLTENDFIKLIENSFAEKSTHEEKETLNELGEPEQCITGEEEVGVEEVGIEEVGIEEVGVEEVGIEEVGVEEVGIGEMDNPKKKICIDGKSCTDKKSCPDGKPHNSENSTQEFPLKGSVPYNVRSSSRKKVSCDIIRLSNTGSIASDTPSPANSKNLSPKKKGKRKYSGSFSEMSIEKKYAQGDADDELKKKKKKE